MKKLSCSGRVHPFFLIIIIILVAIPMGFYGMYLYIAPSLPEMTTLKKAPLLKPLQVYSADNELIAEYGGKLSVPVDYEHIPEKFIFAFLAAEDSAFFEHSGISFKGLGARGERGGNRLQRANWWLNHYHASGKKLLSQP